MIYVNVCLFLFHLSLNEYIFKRQGVIKHSYLFICVRSKVLGAGEQEQASRTETGFFLRVRCSRDFDMRSPSQRGGLLIPRGQ